MEWGISGKLVKTPNIVAVRFIEPVNPAAFINEASTKKSLYHQSHRVSGKNKGINDVVQTFRSA